MKKIITLLLALTLVFSLVACGNTAKKTTEETKVESAETTTQTKSESTETTAEAKKAVIGVSPVPHKDIAEEAKKILENEGIELEIKEFDDYVIPNTSLEEGSLDLNFFQHVPYLESFNTERGTHLVSLGGVHIEPMGVYSKTLKSLDELKDGDTVVIPNDATNGARALNILSENGLITLKDGVGLAATEKDVVENIKNLKFLAVEAPTIPRAYEDAAIAVINSNYAIEAGLSPKNDALVIEKTENNPFANIIAVREADKNNELYKKILAAFQSDQVKKFIEDKYKGEIVPAK